MQEQLKMFFFKSFNKIFKKQQNIKVIGEKLQLTSKLRIFVMFSRHMP